MVPVLEAGWVDKDAIAHLIETADPGEMKERRREHVFVTQFQTADGYCVAYRNPGLLAKSLTTIDHLSNGRIDCGLGAG